MGYIHTDFTAAAERWPERLAVWADDIGLSYRQLDEASSSLAVWLQARGISRGDRVGMMLPRCVEAAVSILGILKAGAAYVPLDPSWPEYRVDAILKDCSLSLLITPAENKKLRDLVGGIICPGTDEWESAVEPAADADELQVETDDEDLAYILYTSGSTGIPKGVCISHRAAQYFAKWAREEFNVGPNDRIAAVSPFTFDLSTFDLFSGFSGGATVYLVNEKTKMLPSLLSRFLEEHTITVLYAVPSTLTLFAARGVLKKRDLTSLKTILFAGEIFPTAQLKDLMGKLPSGVRYCNLYGPTETNVCTWCDVAEIPVSNEPIPIGKPLPGTRAFTIADGYGEEGDDGIEGELCIAGPGVMSGYWGKQEADGEHWADDPECVGGRAYKTGDLVEKRDDGNWLFRGRKDHMVKLWGYRIELGEVEACLLDCPGVEQAAVVTAKKSEKDAELIAFIVGARAKQADAIDLHAVRDHCEDRLPHYMVPHRIHVIPRMPLIHSGKIDRIQLVRVANEKG